MYDDMRDGPDEDDILTGDHCQFFQYGKLLLTVPPDADHCKALREYMEREQFWPAVWFISDHGNAHLIPLWESA